MINLLVFTQFAGLTKRLALNGIIGQVWALPFLIALHTINTSTTNKWIVFAIVTLLLGYPSNHSVQVGWASRNANTVRTRTVSTAMYNMCCQAGSIVYSNIYRAGTLIFQEQSRAMLIQIRRRTPLSSRKQGFDWNSSREYRLVPSCKFLL